MLMPKRVKRRKVFRGRMKGAAHRGNFLAYGEYGLQATEPCWVTSQQIEAARIALTRYTKRGGQVWIKIFPDKPVTEKPAETRMGSGKGSPEYWVAVVKPGRVLFEIAGVPEEAAPLLQLSDLFGQLFLAHGREFIRFHFSSPPASVTASSARLMNLVFRGEQGTADRKGR